MGHFHCLLPTVLCVAGAGDAAGRDAQAGQIPAFLLPGPNQPGEEASAVPVRMDLSFRHLPGAIAFHAMLVSAVPIAAAPFPICGNPRRRSIA